MATKANNPARRQASSSHQNSREKLQVKATKQLSRQTSEPNSGRAGAATTTTATTSSPAAATKGLGGARADTKQVDPAGSHSTSSQLIGESHSTPTSAGPPGMRSMPPNATQSMIMQQPVQVAQQAQPQQQQQQQQQPANSTPVTVAPASSKQVQLAGSVGVGGQRTTFKISAPGSGSARQPAASPAHALSFDQRQQQQQQPQQKWQQSARHSSAGGGSGSGGRNYVSSQVNDSPSIVASSGTVPGPSGGEHPSGQSQANNNSIVLECSGATAASGLTNSTSAIGEPDDPSECSCSNSFDCLTDSTNNSQQLLEPSRGQQMDPQARFPARHQHSMNQHQDTYNHAPAHYNNYHHHHHNPAQQQHHHHMSQHQHHQQVHLHQHNHSAAPQHLHHSIHPHSHAHAHTDSPHSVQQQQQQQRLHQASPPPSANDHYHHSQHPHQHPRPHDHHRPLVPQLSMPPLPTGSHGFAVPSSPPPLVRHSTYAATSDTMTDDSIHNHHHHHQQHHHHNAHNQGHHNKTNYSPPSSPPPTNNPLHHRHRLHMDADYYGPSANFNDAETELLIGSNNGAKLGGRRSATGRESEANRSWRPMGKQLAHQQEQPVHQQAYGFTDQNQPHPSQYQHKQHQALGEGGSLQRHSTQYRSSSSKLITNSNPHVAMTMPASGQYPGQKLSLNRRQQQHQQQVANGQAALSISAQNLNPNHRHQVQQQQQHQQRVAASGPMSDNHSSTTTTAFHYPNDQHSPNQPPPPSLVDQNNDQSNNTNYRTQNSSGGPASHNPNQNNNNNNNLYRTTATTTSSAAGAAATNNNSNANNTNANMAANVSPFEAAATFCPPILTIPPPPLPIGPLAITSHRTNSPWMRLSSIILTPVGIIIAFFIVISPLLHYLM